MLIVSLSWLSRFVGCVRVRVRVGLFVGGGGIEHDCPRSRCVGYFIEPLLWLAPFAKKPVSIIFNQCITNSDTDLRYAAHPRTRYPFAFKFSPLPSFSPILSRFG